MGEEREKTAVDAVREVCTGGASIHDGLRAIGVDPLGSTDQVQRLRDRVAELEGRVTSRQMQGILERLGESDEKLRKRVAELEKELRETRERRDAAAEWVAEECNAWRSRATSAEARVAELEADNKQMAKRVRQLVNQRAVLLKERDAKHDALQRENAELKEQLTACTDAWWAGKKMAAEASQSHSGLRAKYEALLAVARVPPSVLDYANGHRGVGASWFDAADFIRRLADATKPETPKRKTRIEALVAAGMDEATARLSCSVFGLNPDEEMEESNG